MPSKHAVSTGEYRVAIFKALGDATRLRIVDYLRKHGGEATGTEVAEHAGISLALLCHHADVLVDSGIVRKRKERQTTYWALDREALRVAWRQLGG